MVQIRRIVDGIAQLAEVIRAGLDGSQHQRGGGHSSYAGENLPPAILFGPVISLLKAQLIHLAQNVFLHPFREHKAGKAAIQGGDDVFIHGRGTILSAQIPGACAPGEAG